MARRVARARVSEHPVLRTRRAARRRRSGARAVRGLRVRRRPRRRRRRRRRRETVVQPLSLLVALRSRARSTAPSRSRSTSPLQSSAWRFVVSHAGRPVRTSALAKTLQVTREHLSRDRSPPAAGRTSSASSTSCASSPPRSWRRIPATTCATSPTFSASRRRRICRAPRRASSEREPASLTRLRTVDLVDRFVKGHGRSRG